MVILLNMRKKSVYIVYINKELILLLKQKNSDLFILFYFSDYMAVDNDFWDAEFGDKKRKRKSDKSSPERRRGFDRESILQRYKIMQVKLQDRNGNFFTVKKKVR